jgi:hypothetical protein
MGFQRKKEEYIETCKDMARDLKPIFDRLIDKSDEYIEETNSVDMTDYVPSCGITKRLPSLTPEQKNDIERQIDITKTAIRENPEDYPELVGMASASSSQAGTGKGANVGMVRIKKLPFPKWLEDLETNIGGYLAPDKGRKGMDYEAAISGRIRKAKEKVIMENNSLYVLLDTSGSMTYYKDKYGNSILKLFSSFFPTIAEKYSGQIWMVDYAPYNAPIAFQNILELDQFKSSTKIPIMGGGGTSFWGAFQMFQKKEMQIKEKNPEAKVMMVFMSDMEVDLKTYPELIPENLIMVAPAKLSGNYKLQAEQVVNASPLTRKLIYFETTGKLD